MLLVLTRHAIRMGLIDVSFYLTDSSAALDFYSYAALLLGRDLVRALWVRFLGPAVTVIPWLVFYLSVRSQDGYFLLMTPLWLAAAATAPPSAFAHAWQPRISLAARPIGPLASGGPRRLPGYATRALLAAILLAPSLLCASVAIASDEPLELAVVSTTWHGPHAQGLWRMSVDVVNGGDGLRLRIHHQHRTECHGVLACDGGPAVLAPHQRATCDLTASAPAGYDPGLNGFYLRAMTDRPMTEQYAHPDPVIRPCRGAPTEPPSARPQQPRAEIPGRTPKPAEAGFFADRERQCYNPDAVIRQMHDRGSQRR